jgi:hypothetical protein
MTVHVHTAKHLLVALGLKEVKTIVVHGFRPPIEAYLQGKTIIWLPTSSTTPPPH